MYSKFTGEHPCWSVISIKLLCNFTEIALWHRCSPVNLLHNFRTPFLQNTSGRLLPKRDLQRMELDQNPWESHLISARKLVYKKLSAKTSQKQKFFKTKKETASFTSPAISITLLPSFVINFYIKTSLVIIINFMSSIPEIIYLFKFNSRNIRRRCRIFSKLTAKMLERYGKCYVWELLPLLTFVKFAWNKKLEKEKLSKEFPNFNKLLERNHLLGFYEICKKT